MIPKGSGGIPAKCRLLHVVSKAYCVMKLIENINIQLDLKFFFFFFLHNSVSALVTLGFWIQFEVQKA